MSSSREAGDPSPRSSPAVEAAFLQRFLEDQASGKLRSLVDYQALFPGFEELVAREHAQLAGDVEPVSEEAAARAALPESLRGSEAVPGYELLDVLGQGGMGTVYRARQLGALDREVALKVVRPGMDSREIVARFESERRALARMRHPGIAQVFDAGTTADGRPFFAMELVPGEPVTECCARHRVPFNERLAVFKRVCDAVQHAHQCGIIHRDLKPSNVLVVEVDGALVPKVIDFGIAKSLEDPLGDSSLHTQVGQVIGTPDYMSPEQAEFGGLGIDTRVDIYSLGVILYELLTGELPFRPQGDSAIPLTEKLRRISEEEVERPSARIARLGQRATEQARACGLTAAQLQRICSQDFDWVVVKALEKDPARRYPSAAHLELEIERYLAGESLLAGPPTWTYRAGKFIKRRRSALIAMLVFIVLASLTALFSAHRARERELARRRQLAAQALEEGRETVAELELARARVEGLERDWQAARASWKNWVAAWDRGPELELWTRLNAERAAMPRLWHRSLLAFNRARERAPEDFEPARRAALDLYWERYEHLVWSGESMDREYFAGFLRELERDGEYTERLEGRGEVELYSDPPGAAVHLFRYELLEGRLVPLAWRPGPSEGGGSIVGEPRLVVDRTWPEMAATPLRAGDLLEAIDGSAVCTLTELVARLRDADPGSSVTARVLRSGERMEIAIALPAAPIETASGEPRFRDSDALRRELGITFEAYPLDLSESSRVGMTRADRSLRLSLPRGSYLLVLVADGYVEARWPLAFPAHPRASRAPVRVRLYTDEEVPPGFVPIAAGGFSYGGDVEADQPLDAGYVELESFFISRFEVTNDEYYEFYRDAMRTDRIVDKEGHAEPLVDWSEPRIRELLPVDELPRLSLLSRRQRGDRPVVGVSVLAGLEYTHWLETVKYPGRWRFRLPTDLEWEKAARGVDRRVFVWGNYHVWGFAVGEQRRRQLKASVMPVGAEPIDESVWGVRDLAGSAAEPLLERRTDTQGVRYLSLRGASWQSSDAYYFRVANRNGARIEDRLTANGLRIVAELLPRRASASEGATR